MSAELERARVLLTRPAADVAELADGIRALGGEPTCIPMIRIAGTTEPDALAAARDRIDAFDWIALTSRHAARALLDGIGAPGAGAPRICAVGASTAAAAREAGWEPAVVAPGRGGADALADELLATGDLTGQRILYPCSNLARPVLAERLIAVGAAVEQVEAYRTVPPAEVPGSPVAYDLAVFGSPSAAINYAQLPEPRRRWRRRSSRSPSGPPRGGPSRSSAPRW